MKLNKKIFDALLFSFSLNIEILILYNTFSFIFVSLSLYSFPLLVFLSCITHIQTYFSLLLNCFEKKGEKKEEEDGINRKKLSRKKMLQKSSERLFDVDSRCRSRKEVDHRILPLLLHPCFFNLLSLNPFASLSCSLYYPLSSFFSSLYIRLIIVNCIINCTIIFTIICMSKKKM